MFDFLSIFTQISQKHINTNGIILFYNFFFSTLLIFLLHYIFFLLQNGERAVHYRFFILKFLYLKSKPHINTKSTSLKRHTLYYFSVLNIYNPQQIHSKLRNIVAYVNCNGSAKIFSDKNCQNNVYPEEHPAVKH